MAETYYDGMHHCIKPKIDMHDIAVYPDSFLDMASRVFMEYITPKIVSDDMTLKALKKALGIQHGELTYQYETMEDGTVQPNYKPPDPDWYCSEYQKQLDELNELEFTAALLNIASKWPD